MQSNNDLAKEIVYFEVFFFVVSFPTTDVEVNWCMEVMCYGLRLPLKEHEAIKNCVHVYCEWLISLIPEQAKVRLDDSFRLRLVIAMKILIFGM